MIYYHLNSCSIKLQKYTELYRTPGSTGNKHFTTLNFQSFLESTDAYIDLLFVEPF